MARDRLAPEPALSDVVRRRLAALLDEVPARRAIGPDELDAPPPAVPAPAPAQAWDVTARSSPPVLWARAAWEFSRHHLVAVGVVLLTGCLWAGYNVLQARSTPVAPVAPPSVVASASPSPSATPRRILVHVLGAVGRPGVVSLPEGSRVQDAIAAGGGLTDAAAPAELNLAAVLADGAQLVIGDSRSPRGEVRGATAGGSAAPGELSLNTATQAELEELPGVGPVTAARIIAWREQHGRFSSVEELQEVDGIGPKTYSQLAGHVRV
ncbi:MAG: ComEA family DNA-binding protein [Propionicimonas sp.]